MADKRANLIITLKDEASAGLEKLGVKIESARAALLKATVAFTALVAAGASAVKSFIESEDAANKLNIALKNQGIFSEVLATEMRAYASELQKTSTFSDEAIVRTQAMLTTFGLAGSAMQGATKATLDLAAGLGVDLNTAALLVGKAFAGETGTLSRYGIIIDETIPRSEKFAEVLRQLSQRFGGEAQAAASTFSGRLQVLHNQFDDMKEDIGGALIPMLETIVSKIKFFSDGIQQLGGIFPTVFLMILSTLQDFVTAFGYAIKQIPILGTVFDLVGLSFDGVNAKIQEQIDRIMQLTLTHQAEGNNQLMTQQMVTRGMIDIKNRELAERQKIEDKAKAVNEKRVASDLQDARHVAELHKQLNEERQRNYEQTFAYISSLSKAKNKELAAIGKAAAIAHAYIDTYAAANVALRSAPPPFNFALAAAVTAAGLANVAKIVGIQMAEGGLVMPRAGGIPAVIGEAGKAEAVIPLEDERTREKLQQSGFGTGLVININADVIVGGEDSVRALARRIDKELFGLRRNHESVAFEGV